MFFLMLPLVQVAPVLTVVSVEPCDENGKPTVVRAQDPTRGVLVKCKTVVSTPTEFYIELKVGKETSRSKKIQATGSQLHESWVSFSAPFDGSYTISATIDPDRTTGDTDEWDNSISLDVVPKLPAAGIQFFAPKRWRSRFERSVSWAEASAVTKIVFRVPVPTTEAGQTVRQYSGPTGSETLRDARLSQPYSQFEKSTADTDRVVAVWTGQIEASNVFSNVEGALSRWSVFDDLPEEVMKFREEDPEDANARDLVRSFTARHRKPGQTPWEAARAVFRGTVAELQYDAKGAGELTDVFRSLRCHCAGFAGLYVAALRSMGIPARTVQGWMAGENVWHVWTEMYVPGHGWLPQDPTSSDGYDPTGKYLVGFSSLHDLNQRIGVARGGTYDFGNYKTAKLQKGIFTTYLTKTIETPNTFACSLQPAN